MKNYKSHFPIFKNNPNLIFLDSAASSQKPQKVLDDVKYFCENNYANVHRGAYSLSLQSTEKIETARQDIAQFFGTQAKNCIFTKNTTDASNIYFSGFLQKYIESNETCEIIMPVSEHHAVLLPALQNALNHKNITLKYIYPENDTNNKNFGMFDEKNFEKSISSNTNLVITAHISNVTGQIFNIQKISEIIQKQNEIRTPENKIHFAVDASQSAPHTRINFDAIGCDAMFITGHKLGAGGIGALLLSDETEKNLPLYSIGGGIVNDVWENKFSLVESSARFEAGTPSIENIIGFQSAISYLKNIGMKTVEEHEAQLTEYALKEFASKLPNYIIVGNREFSPISPNRSSNISFYHKNIHHTDLAILLAEKNIAVRAGMHCANPLHHFLNIKGTVRASFWIYSDFSDIDALIKGLQEIEMMFS